MQMGNSSLGRFLLAAPNMGGLNKVQPIALGGLAGTMILVIVERTGQVELIAISGFVWAAHAVGSTPMLYY